MNPKILSPLFALLIFVAHLNCVLEHRPHDSAPSVKGKIAATDAADQTSKNHLPAKSEQCDHGCICQGATLAGDFVWESSIETDWHFFFATLMTPQVYDDYASIESDFSTHRFIGVPLRAIDRCVLLQTYLI